MQWLVIVSNFIIISRRKANSMLVIIDNISISSMTLTSDLLNFKFHHVSNVVMTLQLKGSKTRLCHLAIVI